MKYKYLFGPLPSRRLGQSLGIDVIPPKVCSMNCVYCEVGRTTKLTNELQDFCSAEAVIAEVQDFFDQGNHADYLTLCGSGEPTLWSEMGTFIHLAKEAFPCKIALITNSLHLSNPDVVQNCLQADLVMPSLDAMNQDAFLRLTRPVPGTKCSDVAESLVAFRQKFSGDMWLEVLLIAGINDAPHDIEALRVAIEKINPDQTQLNTLVRPGTENNIQPLAHAELSLIASQLAQGGQEVTVISSYRVGEPMSPSDILEVLRRRPCSAEDITAMMGLSADETIVHWVRDGKIIGRKVDSTLFYSCKT